MSDTQAQRSSIDEHDESVQIAIMALGDMRSKATASRNLPPRSASDTGSSTSAQELGASSASSSTSTDVVPADLTPAGGPASAGPAFVTRVMGLPFVNSTLQFYEQGKASSRVVKYGAGLVESSVKTISKPVINRLPVNVDKLDEFACRQLDKLDKYRRPSTGEASTSPVTTRLTNDDDAQSITDEPERGRPISKTRALEGSAVADEDDESQNPDGDDAQMRDPSISRTRKGTPSLHSGGGGWQGEKNIPKWLEANSPFVGPPPPPPDSRSATPTQSKGANALERSQSRDTTETSTDDRQVAQRSRWQAMLLEAGGLSAALSEESMRRLKFCLQWLQYATAHIDAQILILRDFTASLQPLPSDSSSPRRPPISDEHMRKLTEVRKDLVQTIRQVVDVVSKYAGGALPEPARSRVRGFILKLPQRWASASKVPVATLPGGGGAVAGERETIAAASGAAAGLRQRGQRRAAQRERGAGADRSSPPSRAQSPVRGGSVGASSGPTSPRIARATIVADGQGNVSAGTALVAAQRILTLATESLDMMRNVTGVVKESLDRADAWVGRLRTVGIQRGTADGAPDDAEDSAFEIPEAYRHARHQRHDSASTIFSDVGSEMELDRDGITGEMPSPFFSSASSTTTGWAGSIPSTPGGNGYPSLVPNGQHYNYAGYSGKVAGSGTNPSSPRAVVIPLGSMTIHSRCGSPTPKEEEQVHVLEERVKMEVDVV